MERVVGEAIKRECRSYNRKQPEVIVIAHEADSKTAGYISSDEGQGRQRQHPVRANPTLLG